MYNCLTVYFKRLTASYILRTTIKNTQRIRTDRDVRGSMQKRVCVANSSLSSVQGGSLLNSDRDVRGSHQ